MGSHSKLVACTGLAGAALASVPYLIKALRKRHDTSTHQTKPDDLEFGGPVGAFATMLCLPGVIIILHSACKKDFVIPGIELRKLLDIQLPEATQLISGQGAALFAGWFGFQVLLERMLPGEVVEGVDLTGTGGNGKLKYRMNGHLAFWTSMLAAFTFRDKLPILYDQYEALSGASIGFSILLSTYLYASSFRPSALLAKGGNSGNAVYDFFIGRELNPRIGSFDLKQFCELRPGLIGWTMLNLGMAAKQYQQTGSVSASMILVNVLQGLYVWDSLYQERAILTTMDITTDGFGYMLAFGDLAWVPFTYGLQAKYLVDHDPGLSMWQLAGIAACGLAGYVIFRASNSEKDRFRKDPNSPTVQHLQVLEVQNMQTGKPSKLLVSGWWGLARKINYTGDWIMSWAWSSATGCPVTTNGTLITYFYPIYFAVLLIHRAGRDDHFCSQKYGQGWEEYKKRVKYVFVPFVI